MDGREVRESCKTDDQAKAEKVYKARVKELHRHQLDLTVPFLQQRDRKRSIADLLDALKADYELRGIASKPTLSNIAKMRAQFGAIRAIALSSEEIDGYIQQRLQDGYAKATVNRGLQLLGQA